VAQRRIGSGLGVILAALSLALGGCAPMTQYVVRQGIGQINMLLHSVPIDETLVNPQLDVEGRRKLELLVEARDFARDQLGLHVGGSFARYHDTGGQPVAYNLSAARQDALAAKSWRFPIVGTIDYLGFFSRRDAEDEAAQLQKQGYDTYIYGVDAYSTLGWFPDPVHSTFLRHPDGTLVEIVIHELAHNTVYAAGQSTFNESSATFIGRRGARLFFERRGDEGRDIIAALETSYADQERITDWLIRLENELRDHYARDIPPAEKIAGREAIFQAARDRFTSEVLPTLREPDRYRGWAKLPTNNAYVLLNRRYHYDLGVFDAVYEGNHADFAAFLNVLRAAAQASDPFAYLRQAAGSP